jgi:hypothetical protein
MRDWTKLLLIVCVVALGAGIFVLERRIAGLETQLQAARSDIAALAEPPAVRIRPLVAESRAEEVRPQVRVVVPRKLEISPPTATIPVPTLERQPSGVINGVPYYHHLLSQSER